MRRAAAALLLAALAAMAGGCREQPEGTLRVVIIGDQPKLRDPALGDLSASQQLLLANIAQGLVRFDAAGNVVGGLAERWTMTDDGLSYIFRLAPAEWPDGRKVTAEQVARSLKRQLASRSKNDLKDRLGSVEDVVAMTDRVLEIRLIAPRPELLSLLAQPEFAIIRDGEGTGPFTAAASETGETRLTREIVSPEDEKVTREQLLLTGMAAPAAIKAFVAGKADLVLGGTFANLPLARSFRLPRGCLRFDPASGLFGLVPTRSGGALDKPGVRQLLSQAINREAFVTALGVPNLAARATLLEPGLEGTPAPVAPAWTSTPLGDRLPALQAEAKRLFPDEPPVIRVSLPESPGGALLLRVLQRSWGNLGLKVEYAERAANADFVLVDEVAPSAAPAWFIRRFRCAEAAVCDPDADELMEAARTAPVPAQRYALLAQAAALVDGGTFFIPITAPVRWSLVSARIPSFAGNRYAHHTLTGLDGAAETGE